MSPEAKRTWGQILHQLPTVAVLVVVFASGGWKNSVDDRLEGNCDEIILLQAENLLQDDKDEQLEERIIELEAVARERWLQIQSLQVNQNDIRNMVREMYQWMLEDRQ